MINALKSETVKFEGYDAHLVARTYYDMANVQSSFFYSLIEDAKVVPNGSVSKAMVQALSRAKQGSDVSFSLGDLRLVQRALIDLFRTLRVFLPRFYRNIMRKLLSTTMVSWTR